MLNSCYASGVDSSNVLYSSKDSRGGVGVEIQLLQLFWSRTCLKSCWLLVQKSAKMYLIKKFASHWLPEAKVEFLSDLWADGIDILATKVVKHQVLKLNTGVHQGCWCLYQAVYWAWVLSWVRAKQNLSPWTPQLVLILLVLCHTIRKLQELKINGTIGEQLGKGKVLWQYI